MAEQKRQSVFTENHTWDEITTAFLECCKEHPIFSRMVCRIPGWKWESSYEEFLELACTLRGIASKPK